MIGITLNLCSPTALYRDKDAAGVGTIMGTGSMYNLSHQFRLYDSEALRHSAIVEIFGYEVRLSRNIGGFQGAPTL